MEIFMGKIAFVADYFLDELPAGGAEQCNEVIIKLIGREVDRIKCEDVTVDTLQTYTDIIISNHQNLPSDAKKYLISSCNYSIIEHDFGCLITRDVSFYENNIAPKSHLIDIDFYKKAYKVFLQSDPHYNMWVKNTGLTNLVSFKANPYDEEDIAEILLIAQNSKKLDITAIIDNPLWQKNTAGAIEFCKHSNLKYKVIPRMKRVDYLSELSNYSSIVLLPMVFESFSRVACESALCGLKIYSNNNVPFTQSYYSKFKGKELGDFLIDNNKYIKEQLDSIFQ